MTKYKDIYDKKVMTASKALDLIRDGDYIFSAQVTGALIFEIDPSPFW